MQQEQDAAGDNVRSAAEAEREEERRQFEQTKKQLQGQVKSAKAELVRLQCQLRDFQTKHFRHMEHLRFLINNRLHAKGDLDASQAQLQDDGLEGLRFQHEQKQGRRRRRGKKSSDAFSPAASVSALSSSAQCAVQARADWKEAIKPIGYLQSCFRRKVCSFVFLVPSPFCIALFGFFVCFLLVCFPCN